MNLDHRTMDSVQSSPIYEDFMRRYDAAYALELEHFLDVMQGNSCVINYLGFLLFLTSESPVECNLSYCSMSRTPREARSLLDPT